MFAVVLGVGLFPVLLVFPPVYFPWSIVVVACAGAAVGVTVHRARAERALALAIGAGALLPVVALLVVGRAATTGNYVALFAAQIGLFLPATGGAAMGTLARRRLGAARGAAIVAAGAVSIAGIGLALAVALAPSEVANAPRCDPGRECARAVCWMTAERRRILTVERVVSYDGQHLTCAYTAWGGILVGTVSDGSWADGPWPGMFLRR